jgi:UDPglucose 6-dehydrogenase
MTVAVWGLAFKPNTDDIREAPALNLIGSILNAGGRVRAHDPKARDAVAAYFDHDERLELVDDPYEAVHGADALALVTEWRQYWAPDFERIASLMQEPVVLDGRNIWAPETLRSRGFTYFSIGRP